MKTAFAIFLAAAATLAVPASAQTIAPGAAAAIAHFNRDADSQDDRSSLRNVRQGGVTVSTRSRSLDQVFAHFNRDADNQDGIHGLNGGTTFASVPSRAQDIFTRIRAERLEDQ